MSADSPITESLPEASIHPQRQHQDNHSVSLNEKMDSNHIPNYFDDVSESYTSPSNAVTASILLEPSEYFFDDEFAVPFDANLRDETSTRQHGFIEESDEGISSSGTINRGVPHSRSDSFLFSPPDSGDSGQGGTKDVELTNYSKFEPPIKVTNGVTSSKSVSQCPDSTSTPNDNFKGLIKKHRTMSADLSTIISDVGECDPVLDNYDIKFSYPYQACRPVDPTSVTTSWMQAVMEGSCNPRLKALLKRTAEALDYKLAWGEIQTDPLDVSPCILSPHTARLQRSTSQGNILTTASLAGIRQALETFSTSIRNTNGKQMRSIGVATSDSEPSNDEASLPDTTTATGTTTWARVRSSRESLNSHKHIAVNSSAVIPPPSLVPLSSIAPVIGTNAQTGFTPLQKSIITWRAVKDAADNEMTTWEQLRRTASVGNHRSKHATSVTNCTENVSLDPNNKHNFANLLRVRSNNSPVSRKAMHRYSGTLLEVFMRARAMDLMYKSLTASKNKPQMLKQLGPSFTEMPHHTFSTRSLQTNTSAFSIQTIDSSKAEQLTTPGLCTGRLSAGRPLPSSNPKSWFDKLISPNGMSSVSNVDSNIQKNTFSDVPAPKASRPPRRSSVEMQLSPQRQNARAFAFGQGGYRQPELATKSPYVLLTTSAGPESECMSRLREHSPHYVKNPRATLAYPGLGLMTVPKPSRIESNTFLSLTLPDLALLSMAAADEVRSGTPTMPKHGGSPARVHGKRRATSAAAPVVRGNSGNRARFGRKIRASIDFEEIRGISNLTPGHGMTSNRFNTTTMPQETQIKDTGATDRSTSEPQLHPTFKKLPNDPMFTSLTGESRSDKPLDQRSQSRGLPASSQRQPTVSEDGALQHYKKSVSFSGHMHTVPCNMNPLSQTGGPIQSPDPKVIPRNWGIYGKEPPPLAEFQPHDIGGQSDVSSSTRPSDVDIRYHAMVKDIIRAVQETIAYFCQQKQSKRQLPGNSITSAGSGSTDSSSSIPVPTCTYYSSLAAIGGSGRSSLLAVVGPLTVLISDGLLQPSRAIFPTKPRSRIWLLVEESCRPSNFLPGIASHTVNTALSQVKALTGALTEKIRFRVFICACLNLRALPLWLNSLVANEALLKRFYCDGAFIRQCTSSLQGLHADLMTHVEQLLKYPFQFDLSVESKKPLQSLTNPQRTTPSASTSTKSKSVTKKAAPPASNATSGRASSAAPFLKASPSSNMAQRTTTAATDAKMRKPSATTIPAHSSNLQNKRALGSSGATSIDTQASSISTAAPIKPTPLSSPSSSSSMMRGKLRTALSTFRRSTAAAISSNCDHPHSKFPSRSSGIPVPCSASVGSDSLNSTPRPTLRGLQTRF